MKRDIPVTQIEAHDQTRDMRETLADQVEAIVRSMPYARTLAEITAIYNRKHGARKPESTISGVLNRLEAKGIVANYHHRECEISGRVKQTWDVAPPATAVQLTLGRAS